MASFDYRLNPLYPIKECSTCGALYTTNYCCSEGSLGDKIICDTDKTPDLSQRPPQNYPKSGHLVDGHYCQGCALLRKKFKEDLFTYCIENGILQDSFEPSNDIFFHQCTCELCGNGAHYGYNFLPKDPIIPNPEPFNNQTVNELPQTLPSFDPTCYPEDGNSFTYDPTSNLVHESPNVFDPPSQLPLYSYEFYGTMLVMVTIVHLKFRLSIWNRVTIKTLISTKTRYWRIPACYDNDDDDYTIAITPKEPDNSLSMGDEHLDTVLAMESDEFIKSSVENLVPNPSESEGEYECDVPACEVFTTFSNILFDSNYDFFSSDDQSFFDEDIPKEIYSNPLFDEEIISMKIDLHHFNAESDLVESLLNRDSPIISSSSKIDSLFDEFAGELTLLKSTPPGINETDCDPEEETCFVNRLLYDNLTPHEPMPSGIKEDNYDSERDILILEELLDDDSFSLPKNESFHFDIPSSSHPPAKPPDDNTGILNVKVMGDMFENNVPLPRLKLTLVPSQKKSPKLLPHLGHENFQPSTECPMMIYGKNTPILDVPFFHFYPH
uniref:Uncharacterized protein n=1 Tax=Tanacetum cinerariifolium TaxID=118510 RepID=A0A6L2KGI0_TANCI|nr:hypothetical protein [Tanacetum cinerariifolium]